MACPGRRGSPRSGRRACVRSGAGLQSPVVLDRAGGLCDRPPRLTRTWWRVALPYVILLLLLDRVLADPNTGAITRVLLPLTAGFNVLLATESRRGRFWTWFAAGNLHLLSALTVMPLFAYSSVFQ